jgi:hypothetical protein
VGQSLELHLAETALSGDTVDLSGCFFQDGAPFSAQKMPAVPRTVDSDGRKADHDYKNLMSPASLSVRHFLLAIAVVAVWGTNFVIIRIGLDHLPPLFFAALRFVFALLPSVFFLRRPAVSWGNLAAYGFLTGAGQFGALFLAMEGSISPGLASLVIQAQVSSPSVSRWRSRASASASSSS